MKIKTVHEYTASASSFTLLLFNLFIGIFFAWVGNYVFQIKVGGEPLFVDPKFVKFCNLIVGIIAFLIIYVFEFDIKLRENLKNFGSRLDEFDNTDNSIIHVGTALKIFDDHLPEIRNAALQATSISNTLIFHGGMSPSGLERSLLDYLEQTSKNRDALITMVAKKKVRWVEIFSRNVSRELDLHIRALRAKRGAYYRPFVMKEKFPIVNFVLFHGGKPEVWFGFGLFTLNIDGPVFRTTSPELIAYFQLYFDELKSGCIEWHGVDQESFLGTWITVVYLNNKIRDCAKLMIVEKNHVLKVKAEIYLFNNQQRTFGYQNEFVSSDSTCELTTDAVRFKFNIINDVTVPPQNRQVDCVYEITDFLNPNNFIGHVKINSMDHIKIFGGKLSDEAETELRNAEHADTAAFLSRLITNRSINEQEPLADEIPFSGNKFK